MKKRGVKVLLLLLSSAFFQLMGTVEWHGAHTPHVQDENLEITGKKITLGHIARISAVTQDVDVTIVDGDVSLKGNSSHSTLYLRTTLNHAIRFHNVQEVDFEKLLIIAFGPGTVEFVMENGSTLEFGPAQADPGDGVLFLQLMNVPFTDEYTDSLRAFQNNDGIGTIVFSRASDDQPDDVSVVIGANSMLGFIGSEDNTQEQGHIVFSVANNNIGRFILDIKDKGLVKIGGVVTNELLGGKIEKQNIDFAVPAAGTATLLVESDIIGDNASLLVLNENQTLSEFLWDPFFNLDTRNETTDYIGTFNGAQYGFVLTSAGVVQIGEETYFDYVGLANNQTPTVIIPGTTEEETRQSIKERNPSAFIVDGSHNPIFADRSALIVFDDHAGLFFRSGVGADGSVNGPSSEFPFAVSQQNTLNGVGNYVLDVEGPLQTQGLSAQTSRIEILSLFVDPTGGFLFADNTGDPIFPLRTFSDDIGLRAVLKDARKLLPFVHYNAAAFLINNSFNIADSTLSHTDAIHTVIEDDHVNSESSYVGGETFAINATYDFPYSIPRPFIGLENSRFFLHTSAAITGMDINVPTIVNGGVLDPNFSNMTFFNNGPEIDNGTGRSLILGTNVGANSVSNLTLINNQAFLNIIQTKDFLDSMGEPIQQLELTTAPNTPDIIPILGNTSISSIHVISMDNGNIEMGIDPLTNHFLHTTTNELFINGNFFSFRSNNGNTAIFTGLGAIFVDQNGILRADPSAVVDMQVPIIVSGNGMVVGPFNFTNNGTNGGGIEIGGLDLRNPATRVIVPVGTSFSNLILNWQAIVKDYNAFSPYQSGSVTLCQVPPVTESNVSALPVISGSVDLLSIAGSRFGDAANLIIDGGLVRQTIFRTGNGAAPVGTFILRNNGSLGLGAINQSISDPTPTLGANGITIIADGSGLLDINQDMLITGRAVILKGPNFAQGDVLTISAPTANEIRVKSGGILDLRSFDDGSTIAFDGQVQLIFEPGSQLLTSNGAIDFQGNSLLLFEPSQQISSFFNAIPLGAINNTLPPFQIADAALQHNAFDFLINYGNDLSNTDPFRVIIAGQGTINLRENSRSYIPNGAIVGIETIQQGDCEIPLTSITLNILDNAQFQLAAQQATILQGRGGVLQIGNTVNREGHLVNFNARMEGPNAQFVIDELAMFGLGVGVVRPSIGTITPSQSLLDTLNNVGEITINLVDGTFDHSRIYPTNDVKSSILAINPDINMTFQKDVTNPELEIRGGGNMVLIEPGTGALSPIVEGVSGPIGPRLTAELFASEPLQDLNTIDTGSGAQVFNDIRTYDVSNFVRVDAFGRANAGSVNDLNESVRLDAILNTDVNGNGTIVRTEVVNIISDFGTAQERRTAAIDLGGVFVQFTTNPPTIFNPSLIQE